MLGTDSRADLLVSDKAGQTVLVVELKNRRELPRDVAIQLRRNLLAHFLLAGVPYFMLLSQDRGYLWTEEAARDALAPPSREFSMQPVIARFAVHPPGSRHIGEPELASIVFRWLQALTQSTVEAQEGAEQALREAGVTEAIRGGGVAQPDRW